MSTISLNQLSTRCQGRLEKRNELYEENRLFLKKWYSYYAVLEGYSLRFYPDRKKKSKGKEKDQSEKNEKKNESERDLDNVKKDNSSTTTKSQSQSPKEKEIGSIDVEGAVVTTEVVGYDKPYIFRLTVKTGLRYLFLAESKEDYDRWTIVLQQKWSPPVPLVAPSPSSQSTSRKKVQKKTKQITTSKSGTNESFFSTEEEDTSSFGSGKESVKVKESVREKKKEKISLFASIGSSNVTTQSSTTSEVKTETETKTNTETVTVETESMSEKESFFYSAEELDKENEEGVEKKEKQIVMDEHNEKEEGMEVEDNETNEEIRMEEIRTEANKLKSQNKKIIVKSPSSLSVSSVSSSGSSSSSSSSSASSASSGSSASSRKKNSSQNSPSISISPEKGKDTRNMKTRVSDFFGSIRAKKEPNKVGKLDPHALEMYEKKRSVKDKKPKEKVRLSELLQKDAVQEEK